jgi:aryl-alcohol dehydrogenase-like predicted oxidoreductase
MSKLALGTVQFGINYGINSINGQVQLKEVESILAFAKSKGITFLDTAPTYGTSEKVLGNVGVRTFNVITKTRHYKEFGKDAPSSGLIENDFINSLKSLNCISIYGLLVHNVNVLFGPNSKTFFSNLVKLKEQKKIKKIGVSVYDHIQLKFIIENFDIDIVQIPFNIIDKRMIDSGMLSKLHRRGIEIHARSIFLQGLLLMSKQNKPHKFRKWDALWKMWHEWLNDNEISALEACLRFPVSIPEISKVLVGVDSKDQLKEIVNAYDGTLPNMPDELYSNDTNLLNPSNWDKL